MSLDVNLCREIIFMKKSDMRAILRRVICFKSIDIRIEIFTLSNILIEWTDLPALSVLFSEAGRSNLNLDKSL